MNKISIKKKKPTTILGMDVEKGEHKFAADGITGHCSHRENQCGCSFDVLV